MSVRKFYDPLYDVVAFQKRYYGNVKSSIFSSLVQETTEVQRLNFVKQEGLMWLAFPSVTHSRYAATLGTWHLADVAIDNIAVVWRDAEGDSDRTNLGTYLGEWVEEFRLAVLLHDIGHFPFSLTIETNDDLKEKYREYNGDIRLIHEDFGVAMLLKDDTLAAGNENLGRVFRLYGDYKKFNADERREWIAAHLSLSNDKVDLDKICYFLDPNPHAEPPGLCPRTEYKNLPPITKSFLKQAKELVLGTVDLGHLDRYGRVTHFVSGRPSGLPVRPFIQNVVIQADKEVHYDDKRPGEFNPVFQIGIASEGVDFAFSILYFVTNVLIPNILNDEERLAYETMINEALNNHWDWLKEEEAKTKLRAKAFEGGEAELDSRKFSFLKFLPFLSDDEVFAELDRSGNRKVKSLVADIRQRRPFTCVGKFQMSVAAYKDLLENAFSVSDLRRKLRETLAEILGEEQAYVRLTKSFGKPITAEIDKDEVRIECQDKGSSFKRKDWMDLDLLYTFTEEGSQNPLANATGFAPSADLVKTQIHLQRRTFWVFVDTSKEHFKNMSDRKKFEKKKRSKFKYLLKEAGLAD